MRNGNPDEIQVEILAKTRVCADDLSLHTRSCCTAYRFMAAQQGTNREMSDAQKSTTYVQVTLLIITSVIHQHHLSIFINWGHPSSLFFSLFLNGP